MKKTRFQIMSFMAAVLAISSLLPLAFAADTLQARLSAATVGFGDTVTLTLTANADQVKSNPDLSPLQDEFEILSQSASSQTTIINGARNATINWVITLSPNSMGKLTIPAVSAGALSSNPLSLNVVDASSLPPSSSASQNLSINVLVDDKPHYVHGEIPITVRVSDGTGLINASLQMPAGKDFTLKQSGSDEYSQAEHDGQAVTIMQRHYMLTPLKSGELTIPPVVLQGTMQAPANQHSPFASPALPSGFSRSPFGGSLFDRMFNTGKQVRVQSTPVTLDIKANPVSDSHWFLPAKKVKVSAEWLDENPNFKVGEAVSRTVRLLALGAAREKLPKLEFSDTDGAQIYLDRSDDRSVDTADGTAAVREFSLSIVPTRAGEITLPAIDVHWWDTEADEQRVASLPAETISATGAPLNPSANDKAEPQGAIDTTAKDNNAQTQSISTNNDDEFINGKVVLGSAITLFTLLGAGLLIRRQRRLQPALDTSGATLQRHSAASLSTKMRQAALKQTRRQVIDACQANSAKATYSAFASWYAEALPGESLDVTHLQARHTALASEFEKLESRLFQASESQQWNGAAFLKAFHELSGRYEKRSIDKGDVAGVPALYPA